MTKRCIKCNQEKPLEEFKERYDMPIGKSYRSKTCRRCETENDRTNARRRDITRRYGLSQFEYLKLYYRQNGCCGICKRHLKTHGQWAERKNVANVDHDHETGKVRGLLCTDCNRAVGMLLNNEQILLGALAYLKAYHHANDA